LGFSGTGSITNLGGGAVRVGNTRVGFDLVVHWFKEGKTPEQIVQDYESLELADVYSVIAYYLRHRDEMDACLKRWDDEGEETRKRHETKYPPVSRAELLKRREAMEKAHASARD